MEEIKIQTCAHADEIAVFCGPPHNIALCNDCYFEQQDSYGKNGKTLKKAALAQIAELEAIAETIGETVSSCANLQDSLINQESLEHEIVKKVDRQFEQLKTIIDEQK
jgi:hypothetical protein